MCEHLQKLVDSGVQYSPTDYKYDMDRYSHEDVLMQLPENLLDGSYERQFRKRLKRAGVSQIQADILCMRFIDELSLKEISQELNIVSARTVLNILNKTLQDLKGKLTKRGRLK